MKQILNFAFLVLILASSCKNEDLDEPENGTVKDFEGNVYHSITIGEQVWMVENLKTIRYQNGDFIHHEPGRYWTKLREGAFCNYDNDADLGRKFGKLYNWYAVNDPRGIAPNGWHVPTHNEWVELINFLSIGVGVSGKAMAAQSEWTASTYLMAIGNDLSKNNSSGFSALPGGCREPTGNCEFYGLGDQAYWWCSDECSNYNAMYFRMTYESPSVHGRDDFSYSGFSVRCIKD